MKGRARLLQLARCRSMAFAVALGCVTDCSGSSPYPDPIPVVPTAPSSPLPPASPVPPARSVATSELEISHVGLTEIAPPSRDAYYVYGATFWLTETTGKSGATITGVELGAPDETDSTGPSCWRDIIRVQPGGTLEVFDRYDALSYCAPSVISRVKASSITIVVSFADDDGGVGTATKTVSLADGKVR